MLNKMIPFFLLCETPMHVGVGSDVGIVDMPIQRERHTGWPKIEASELKGCIRHSFERKYRNNDDKLVDINIVFGYDENGINNRIKEKFNSKDTNFSGALGFIDGRILLFPVKSVKGVFAWITCPSVLNRFFHDLELAGVLDISKKFEIEKNNIHPESSCYVKKDDSGWGKVVLEEFTIDVIKNTTHEDPESLQTWLSENILPEEPIYASLKEKMKKDIIIVSDDLFTQFTNLSTEVITRTKINNDTGTVKEGGLFTEEYLPAETIMYSFAIISKIFGEVKGSFVKEDNTQCIEKFFTDGLDKVIQIGGNANLGKGIISTNIYGGSKK